MRDSLRWALLLLSSAVAAGNSDACYGAGVVIEQEHLTRRNQIWYGLGAEFGGQLPSSAPEPLPIVLATPIDACNATLTQSAYTGRVVLTSRGGCTFVEKARNAQAGNATALLIYNTEPGCLAVGGNLTQAGLSDLRVPVVGLSQQAGEHFQSVAAAGGKLLCWAPDRPRLDPAAAVLWVFAVGTAAAAAVWAGRDFLAGSQRLVDGSRAHRSSDGPSPQGSEAVEVQMVSGFGAVAFVAVASAMLIILFFFLNRIFAVILVALFSVASFQALVAVFGAAMTVACPKLRGSKADLGSYLGHVAVASLVATVPAGLWVAAWFIFDVNTVGWVFQDGMGVALMLLILRQFLLPKLKVACVLLPLCFLYDVFWVFIQPLLTSSQSVMVVVATGGSSHETMPMLLRVPTLWGPPYGTSMLGFGDVVLPGLLLVFARIWDCTFQKPMSGSYFWPLLGGYGGGLLLTYAALELEVGGDQGQPALLYLIPCTLGLCALLAWRRGELLPMWKGIAAAARLKHTQSSAAEPDVEADENDREALLEQP